MLIFRLVLIFPVIATLAIRADEDRVNQMLVPPQPYERVMIIPIHDMIEPALLYIIRRGVEEARDMDAQTVVFAMNTPGGRVDTTEEIVELIEGIRVPTYTLVERNAISAGSIIALATDHIYMMPGSKIGDAMPIMATPQGGMQSLGEAEREKIESYVDSLVRGIAQRKGRDETMASAMVRRSVEYKIGDEVISPEGQILTLTHLEAEKQYEIDGEMRSLLSEGTVADEAEFLSLIAAPDAVIQRVEPSEFEQVARMIAAIAPILLTIGMLGLWIEFQTPGVGWAGLIGALCLGLFFFGHHIAGLAGQEDLLLFLLGIGLIVVEIFVLPGFGVIGLMGILIVLWSLLSAMTPTLPDGSWIPNFQNMADPAKRLAFSMVMTGVGMLILGRFMPKSRAFQWLVLSESTSRDTGYTSSQSPLELVGKTGKALTPLRPGGAAWIEGERYDVVSLGQFIETDQPIRVLEVHGSRIVVEAMEGSSS